MNGSNNPNKRSVQADQNVSCGNIFENISHTITVRGSNTRSRGSWWDSLFDEDFWKTLAQEWVNTQLGDTAIEGAGSGRIIKED